MKFYEPFLDIVPDYPRTRHLPWKANAQRNDLIATKDECAVIFQSSHVYVEEKIDGANCGAVWINDEPIVRNRNHILRKGFQARTPAKMQFSSIWNWLYNNKKCFEALPEGVSVYGEWMYAVHGIEYNALSDVFIAFDLYDYHAKQFINPGSSRMILEASGFSIVPLLWQGKISSFEQLEALTYGKSQFTDGMREGVYVKVGDGKYITHRFKMVRQGFIQGEHWNDRHIKKNGIMKHPKV